MDRPPGAGRRRAADADVRRGLGCHRTEQWIRHPGCPAPHVVLRRTDLHPTGAAVLGGGLRGGKPSARRPLHRAVEPEAARVGIIALVVAAIGFVFAFIPGALIVGWVLLPIGFALSIVALFMKGAKWPAITGFVVSIVGAIVATVVYFLFVSTVITDAMNDAFDQIDDVIAEASEAAEVPDGLDESQASPRPTRSARLSFGETNVWQERGRAHSSAPEPYTPSEFAAGADLPDNVVFTLITIRNSSSENLEPAPFPAALLGRPGRAPARSSTCRPTARRSASRRRPSSCPVSP